jgi:hypothetical protein
MAGNLQNGGSVWRARSSSSCADAAVVIDVTSTAVVKILTPRLLFLFFPSFVEDFFGANFEGNINTSTLNSETETLPPPLHSTIIDPNPNPLIR